MDTRVLIEGVIIMKVMIALENVVMDGVKRASTVLGNASPTTSTCTITRWPTPPATLSWTRR